MKLEATHILAVEDSPTDAFRLHAALKQVPGWDFALRQVGNLATALAALAEQEYDVVLLDLLLPDSSGLVSVDRVHAAAPQTPIIVLTQIEDEANAVQAVRRGAQDYLFKASLDGPLVARAIKYARERKRADRALQESVRQRQILEAEVLRASTREQHRISQDLHDSVGQQLTGLSFMARSLQQRLAAAARPEADSIGGIVEGIQAALTEVRRAIQGLSPVELDAEGLMVALKRLVATTAERFDVRCHFTCSGPVLVEDNEVATQLYRIAQEALHNASKHAHASNIRLDLRREAERLVLEVSDDGRGLPGIAMSDLGMGLHIMHYRARVIGGELLVSSAPGSGTSIRCSVVPTATATSPATGGQPHHDEAGNESFDRGQQRGASDRTSAGHVGGA